MAGPITPIAGAGISPIATTAASGSTAAGPDFADTLVKAVESAGRAERAAEDASMRFANGDPTMAIDQVMISAEKASISLRYAVALKNRAIEAYRELMNTPV